MPLSTETFENRPSQPPAPLGSSACLLCPGASRSPLSGHRLLCCRPYSVKELPAEQESSRHLPSSSHHKFLRALQALPSRWAAADALSQALHLVQRLMCRLLAPHRPEPPFPSTVTMSGHCSRSPERGISLDSLPSYSKPSRFRTVKTKALGVSPKTAPLMKMVSVRRG